MKVELTIKDIMCPCHCRHFTKTNINNKDLYICCGCGKSLTLEEWQKLLLSRTAK